MKKESDELTEEYIEIVCKSKNDYLFKKIVLTEICKVKKQQQEVRLEMVGVRIWKRINMATFVAALGALASWFSKKFPL